MKSFSWPQHLSLGFIGLSCGEQSELGLGNKIKVSAEIRRSGVLGENLFLFLLASAAFLGCGHITPGSAPVITSPSLLCTSDLPLIRTHVIACGAHQDSQSNLPTSRPLMTPTKFSCLPFSLYKVTLTSSRYRKWKSSGGHGSAYHAHKGDRNPPKAGLALTEQCGWEAGKDASVPEHCEFRESVTEVSGSWGSPHAHIWGLYYYKQVRTRCNHHLSPSESVVSADPHSPTPEQDLDLNLWWQ